MALHDETSLATIPWPRFKSYVFPVLCLLIVVAAAAISLSIGKYNVSLNELPWLVVAKLTGQPSLLSNATETVVWQVRFPRVCGGFLIGTALSLADAVYQGLFRNPLVSPDILGVSTGASLGAVAGIFLSLPVIAIQSLAFVGGLVAVACVYAIGSSLRNRDPVLMLVLTGIAVGAMLGAAVAPQNPRRSL